MLLSPYRFAAGGGGGDSAFRYWRLRITGWKYNGSDNTGDVRVAEWQLFTPGDVIWPTSPMTAPSTPSPFVASASSDDGTREAWRAFNNDSGDSSRWISATSDTAPWLKIDMGSAQTFSYTKIAPDGAVNFDGGYYLTGFEVQGSDTGSFGGEETTVYSVSGLAQEGWTASTLRTFTF